MSSFDKAKHSETRRVAIQRQMESMAAAGSSTRSGLSSSAATQRRRGGDSSGSSQTQADTTAVNVDIARRFLWDDYEENTVPDDRKTGIQPPNARFNNPYGPSPTSHKSGTAQADGLWSNVKSSFGVLGGKQHSVGSQGLATINLNDSRNEGDAAMYKPSLMTSCYISFRRFMLRCALAMTSCCDWFRTSHTKSTANGRGKKCYLVLLICLAIAIPVGVAIKRKNSSEETTASRYDTIYRRIVESELSLDKDLSTDGTPQQQALEWITTGDPAQLAPDDFYLLDRYALAVFYYSTHGDNMYHTYRINTTTILPPSDATDGTRNLQTAADQQDAPATLDQLPPEGAVGDDLAARPDWVESTGWMSGAGFCSWAGVACHHRAGTLVTETSYDGNNGIIAFNMTENNVRGRVPRELFVALKDIRWLSFSGNGLFGTVSTELGTLSDLRYLALTNNFFSGWLPPMVANLEKLQYLYVDGNSFLGRLPHSLGLMTNLVHLHIYDNQFTGSITTEIGNLKNLTSLYLDINKLTGAIPTEIGLLNKLVDVRIRDNTMAGPLPSELGLLTKLELLYLDRNVFTGTIPSELGKLRQLTELHLYRNRIGGTLPTDLASLGSLTSLYLDNNRINGTLPTEWGTMIDLEQLYLHRTLLTGTIPTEIGKMGNLRNLRIYTTGLAGTIPTEIGNAWKLETLYLQDNLIEGQVPSTMSELTRLQKMRLYWNGLNGTMPSGVCDLMDVKLVELKSDCGGDIPRISCDCCTACFA